MQNLPWNQTKLPIPKNDSGSKPNEIKVVDNHIYFYSQVDQDTILDLIIKLREVDVLLSKQSVTQGTEKPKIYLHIHSYGGSVFSAMSAIDTIITSNCDVITIVEGCAASAGTLISVVGKERWIRKHSYMLIHQLSSGFWGKYSEFEDEKKNLDNLMETIRGIYNEYTKVPKKELNEILKHDLWWKPELCKSHGLVDKII